MAPLSPSARRERDANLPGLSRLDAHRAGPHLVLGAVSASGLRARISSTTPVRRAPPRSVSRSRMGFHPTRPVT